MITLRNILQASGRSFKKHFVLSIFFPSTPHLAAGVTKQQSPSVALSCRRDEPASHWEKVHSQIATLLNGNASYSLQASYRGLMGALGSFVYIPPHVSEQHPKAGMCFLHVLYQGP